MALLFQKFQEFVRTLAKSPIFAKDPRHLQFEMDINRLFLYTSYNRLGRDANEADVEEIIDMASKAAVDDQQLQVQENVHSQIKNFCTSMDDILPNDVNHEKPLESSTESSATRPSGLVLAIGRSTPVKRDLVVIETKQLKLAEVSQKLKGLIGYSLELKPSEIPHTEAGQGLFLNGVANTGSVIAFYPGVIYSPSDYRHIPGYRCVDLQNPYLIARYDGTVINAKPWGTGGETREVWAGLAQCAPGPGPTVQQTETGSGRIWKTFNNPLEGSAVVRSSDVLERRNPWALAHFANHPPKGTDPNAMVCSYDFPMAEKEMRVYIPNVVFGEVGVGMKRFGRFWFRRWTSKSSEMDVQVMKCLVLVATREIRDEEILLNYRLSNPKCRPSWYTPVDEEEDRRRWG